MARYDRGYDRSLRPASGDWARPYGSRRGMRNDRYNSGERPWVGGYHDGFQGGSSGVPTGGGYHASQDMDRESRDRSGSRDGYDRNYLRSQDSDRSSRDRSGNRAGHGGDYWWLGERAFEPDRERYDDRYRRFNEQTRPRYSPVGGTYHAMGGDYPYRRTPGPLREERWFSDWTRWF
jgi:hypothetical protein